VHGLRPALLTAALRLVDDESMMLSVGGRCTATSSMRSFDPDCFDVSTA
jgi:hypothetical protein